MEGLSAKHFSDHENPIDLFTSLRDGNKNCNKVLRNQILNQNLKPNTKQNTELVSKHYVLNKCFKDYQ